MGYHFDPADYHQYREGDFRYRWLQPQMLYDKLEKFTGSMEKQVCGKSEEGRAIYSVRTGDGPVKILLWSQMHGNEATATLAFIDLFNFLSSNDDKYNAFRAHIKAKLNLVFIPMLNPDGAQRFTRRNAMGIDLNRDARKVSSFEMQTFMKVFDEVRPQFAFNLHDQRNIFSVSGSNKPATISFLTPSANEQKTMDPERKKSMQLIGGLAKLVEEQISGHCARFSDEYYHRALGEYCQGRGVSTVLVESGAYFNDTFRDKARKLNFLILLRAFELIATEEYRQFEVSDYECIPANEKRMMDIVIRGCTIEFPQRTITTDLGLVLMEQAVEQSGELKPIYKVADLGDLDFNYGLKEYRGGQITTERGIEVEQTANFTLELQDGKLKFENGVLDEEH